MVGLPADTARAYDPYVRLVCARPALALLLCTLAACSYDWDRFDPRGDAGTRVDAGRDGAAPALTLLVTPVYPANARWNDYVRNAEPERGPYAQEDQACDGTGTGGYFACIHAGERRKVAVTGRSSCERLTIADALGAFEWECLVDDGTATFFSRGLAAERGLSDLVEPAAWKPNHVTVHDEGTLLGESEPAAWWDNPIVPLPENGAGSGVAFLDHAGAIYVLDASRATNGYRMTVDRVGLVMLDGAELRWAGAVPDNCGVNRCLVQALDSRFLWLEGTFDAEGGATDADTPLYLSSVAFAHVRHATIRGGENAGLSLWRTLNSYAYDVESSGFGGSGVELRNGSSHNALERIVVHGRGTGLRCGHPDDSPCEHNMLRDIVSFRNDGWGVNLHGRCSHTTIRDLVTHSNTSAGLRIAGSDDVDVSRVIVANNATAGIGVNPVARVVLSDVVAFSQPGYPVVADGSSDSVFTRIAVFASTWGVFLRDSSRVTVSHVTAVNNQEGHVAAFGAVDSTIVQALAINSGTYGIGLTTTASGSLFAQIATSNNNERGISIDTGSAPHRFTENLLVGPQGIARCVVGSGADGLVNGTCSDTGVDGSTTYGTTSASNAVLRVDGIDATDSLVGRASDDADNRSHVMGVADAAGIDDWDSFENRFRGWGRESTAPFPGLLHVGTCDGSDPCRIWDVRLRSSDTVFRNTSGDGRTPNEPFVAGEPCPSAVHGDRALADQHTVPNTFLVNALEIFDDDIGDDDGLCETGEACIYSPNFGAYQGEGDYLGGGTCAFQDRRPDETPTTVTGVRMYAYPVNGA